MARSGRVRWRSTSALIAASRAAARPRPRPGRSARPGSRSPARRGRRSGHEPDGVLPACSGRRFAAPPRPQRRALLAGGSGDTSSGRRQRASRRRTRRNRRRIKGRGRLASVVARPRRRPSSPPAELASVPAPAMMARSPRAVGGDALARRSMRNCWKRPGRSDLGAGRRRRQRQACRRGARIRGRPWARKEAARQAVRAGYAFRQAEHRKIVARPPPCEDAETIRIPGFAGAFVLRAKCVPFGPSGPPERVF